MGQVTYRDGIAILQLIAFAVYLGCGIILCLRHGFSKSSGFFIIITFSLLRIIGASFQLATIDHPSTTTYGGAIVCEAVGIAPITVVNLGLLSRLNRFVPTPVHRRVFLLLTVLSIAGISLAVTGGTRASSSTNPFGGNVYFKVAVWIFTAMFLISCFIFAQLLPQKRKVPRDEARVLYCFAACAPLVAVRLIYALIADFANNPDFYIFNGNPTIYLCMAVLEEIIAVGICSATGLTLKKLSAEASSEQTSRSLDVEEGHLQKPGR